MFSLFTACVDCGRGTRADRRKVSLLILGLDNSGKSTVAACLQNNPTEDISPTLGFANGHARISGCDATLLDLGGSERIRDIWSNYYAESHGIVFVVDASDRSKLDDAKETLMAVTRDDRMAGKPLLVFANKQDRAGAMSDLELFQHLSLEGRGGAGGAGRGGAGGAGRGGAGGVEQCRVVSCAALRSLHHQGRVDPRLRRGARWLLDCVKDHWEALSSKVTREYTAQVEADELARKERRERVRRMREEREAREAAETTQHTSASDQQETGSATSKAGLASVSTGVVVELHPSQTTCASREQDRAEGPPQDSSDSPRPPHQDTSNSPSPVNMKGVRLEPLNVDGTKQGRAAKKHGPWSRSNKVAPAPASGNSSDEPTSSWAARKLSAGVITLKSTSSRESLLKCSRESLVSSESIVKDSSESIVKDSSESIVKDSSENIVEDSSENIVKDCSESIVKNSSENIVEDCSGNIVEDNSESIAKDSAVCQSRPLVDGVPFLAVQSPGLGDTHFLL